MWEKQALLAGQASKDGQEILDLLGRWAYQVKLVLKASKAHEDQWGLLGQQERLESQASLDG
jgi:hypothetical protein